jgi:hypothetical protein
MGELDHWVWTVPDLSVGAAWIREKLGSTYFGGRHEHLGSANHILPLDDLKYLEVLGPSEEIGLLTPKLASCAPRIATFAIRAVSLESVASLAADLGLTPKGPRSYTRLQADGTSLSWQLLELRGHNFRDYLPFFIDWGSSPHPSSALKAQSSVESFAVTHPSEELASLYRALDIPVSVYKGARAMTLQLKTPRGPLTLEGLGESTLLNAE